LNIIKTYSANTWIKKHPSYFAIVVIGIYVLVADFTHQYWNHPQMVIEWDIKSYYAYLPATFIYKDLSLSFTESDPDRFKENFWPVETPTGKKAIVTSMGLSFVYAPFFIVAHAITPFTQYEPDGYSMPYKFALMMSCLIYLIIGLVFLKKILEKYFNIYITAITILAIGMGTNLLGYAFFHDAPMSHVYNFALITMFLYYTIKWHETQTIKITIILGLLAGLIALIRPTNILVLLVLIFYDIKSLKEFHHKIIFFLENYRKVLIMAGFFILVWIPQFIYWKYVSGQFFYFSYGELGGRFFFNNPQIYNFLLSYKKGWLVYTPIMLFALAGIPVLFFQLKKFFWPVLIYLLAIIYVLSSWWSWWFGGGFGARSLIDMYAILAIPFASFIQYCFSKGRVWSISIVTIVITLIGYNLFQTKQYTTGAIHYAWMTKDAYWHTFLKLHPDKEFWGLLRRYDYKVARQGIYIETTPNLETPTHEERMIKIEESIRNNEDLMKEIKRKALERGIELDSMIKLDADWIYKKKSKQAQIN